LSKLNELYYIETDNGQFKVLSKLNDNSNTFWASDENTVAFNVHIPTFKSLHKDMHSFIEAYAKQKFGKEHIKELEKQYINFKEFRLLNNLFKHFETREAEISLTKIVHIGSSTFDLICNYKYHDKIKSLNYSDFIILFLTILKDFNIISLKGK
jgi:hypothetical protein